ncbi:MAG TPA: EF-hand domain-containing protein [Burkholderiales bacterium]|nr:EF-hand domain-containing protein [Burkholderiales bacterium]
MFNGLRRAFAIGSVALATMSAYPAMAQAPMGAQEFPPIFWSEKMMTAMDTNKDGMVSRDEFMNYMGQQFDKMDAGKKRMLTKQQFMDKKMMMSTFPTSVSETGPGTR